MDEWGMEVKPGKGYDQPQTLEQRLGIVRDFAKDIGVEGRMVVDGMSNTCDREYEARPERLYVLDGGNIVWRCGLGPFQYDVAGLRSFLQSNYAESKQ
mmetsp:Transcript_24964/g.56621  ORF Transcript_24964/g.56621 Transcript_24964/m.56621 type:complete len:98 (+) Transcript_24964:447-740(+)